MGAQASRTGAARYLRAHYDTFDRLPLNGAIWEYSASTEPWNAEDLSIAAADGTLHAVVADEIARPFVSRLAGTLRSVVVEPAFRVEYDATAGGITELRAPTRRYGATSALAVQATGGVCVDLHDGVVLVKATEAGPTTVAY